MNRRLKWCLVALGSATVGGACGASIATTAHWIDEQPRLIVNPASYIHYDEGRKAYLAVPQLSGLPQPIWVRSTILAADHTYQLTSPVMQVGDAHNRDMQYEIAIPGTLKKGAYTVSIVVGYKLNPIRYVEQSYAVALLLIDGGKNGISSNSQPNGSGSSKSASGKPLSAS